MLSQQWVIILACGLWCQCCRFGNLVARVLGGTNSGIAGNGASTPVASMEEDDELTKEQFKAVLAQVDKGLRALPATAQVKSCVETGI